jgi:hypothetical protein
MMVDYLTEFEFVNCGNQLPDVTEDEEPDDQNGYPENQVA